VDLKPAPNNKDIFLVEYLQQCKITFEPHKQKKGHCAMVQLPAIWTHAELLSFQTEMRQVRRWSSHSPM
jgi:hypothetical protein